jgi:DNA-directed RNA polymerase subunit RPC12/RpoP
MKRADLRTPEPLDWIRNAVYVVAACTAIVGLGYWLGRPFPALFAAVATGILAVLVRWHAASTGYRCPNCGEDFAISAWADFLTPHMLTTKYVKCPACAKRAWMEALIRR